MPIYLIVLVSIAGVILIWEQVVEFRRKKDV